MSFSRVIWAAAFALAAATRPAVAMTLTGTDIKDGGTIPTAHVYTSCGGQNVSPALSWDGQPAAAKSLVLTMIDIDVKPSLWSHWIVTGLPATATSLPRGVPSQAISAMQPMTAPAHRPAPASIITSLPYGPCPPPTSR